MSYLSTYFYGKTILIDATPTTELSPGPYWTLESLHQLTQHNSVCPDRSLKCCSSASSSHHLQDLRSRPLCAVWWWPFRSQNWPRSQMTGVYTARGIPQEFSGMGLKKKWLVDPERQPNSREWFGLVYSWWSSLVCCDAFWTKLGLFLPWNRSTA